MTTRAVAARSDSNPGLIHYHFGGLGPLRLAIAERAGEEALGPLIAEILDATDMDAALDAIERGIERVSGDARLIRLSAQLVAGAGQDSALGQAFRQSIADARIAFADWLGAHRPAWSAERRRGASALVAALIDGLLLHRALDDTAPVGDALALLRDLARA